MFRTTPYDYDMLIDWLQFTIFDKTLDEVLQLVFNKSKEECTHTMGGKNMYDETWTVGHKMHVMTCSTNTRQGINVLFSGSACREYEELYSFKDLFEKLDQLDSDFINFNRIDIAIDYYGKEFNVKTIQRKADKKQMTSRFRTYTVLYEENVSNDHRLGEQVTFGKKISDLHICFYNKLKERRETGYQVDNSIDSWVRCELRFRHEQASGVACKLARDYNNFGKFIKGILRHYLSFKVGVYNGDKEHKYRNDECRWWRNFTQNVPRCKIEKQARSSSIAKKKRYAEMSLNKFMALLYVADRDIFKNLLDSSLDKINSYDLDILNQHFIQNNMQILTMHELKQMIAKYTESDENTQK